MGKIDYFKLNADAWTNAKEELEKFRTAIRHEEYIAAKNGKLCISIAGINTVPQEWFPNLKNAEILGLACGGGQQCPIFAAHGAKVTVTDISDGQLENERYVAEREGYDIHVVKANLADPFPFEDSSFDMIFNPVSNCYIEDISLMWKECARVIRKGGVLMMAFVKEEHFMFDPVFECDECLISKRPLPFNPIRDLTEDQLKAKIEAHSPLVFSHTLTEQIGGLIKAGFEVTDIFEDCDGGGLFDKYMNSYVAVRAIRK